MQSLFFYVSPSQDPYLLSPSCGSDSACNLARNSHPRVTIVSRATTITSNEGLADSQQERRGEVFLETTVNTRVYPYDTLPGAS